MNCCYGQKQGGGNVQSFIVQLLTCSAAMSIPVLFFLMVTPFTAKYYAAKVQYYAWLIFVIGFLIPFRPQFSEPMVRIDIPDYTRTVIHMSNGAAGLTPIDTAQHITVCQLSWEQVAAFVWLIGVIVFLVYHGIKHYHFLKLVNRWDEEITDRHVLILFKEIKIEMGITHKIDLQYCDSIGSPMMIGFINPRFLLPKFQFTHEELYFILKHELIHYKRKDLWYKCLVLMTTAVHWFNPFVYMIAKAIDIQCELSCDEEVIRYSNADARLIYSETLLNGIRLNKKLKTALSTNFYGGKSMKRRIHSIMDMSKKKGGIIVFCTALTFTLGSGVLLAANTQTHVPPEIIKEDIKVNNMVSVRFLPDPAIYEKYSAYGIKLSEDGKRLLYNGDQIRLFVDDHSNTQAFFLDEEGMLDLAIIRNSEGNILGVELISEQKALEYRNAFYNEDVNISLNNQNISGINENFNKYEEYAPYHIEYSENGEILYYNGQRVRLFVDILSDGSYVTYWFDEAGTINVSAVRNSAGQLTAVEKITEALAEKYQSELLVYEQKILNSIDEKTAKKMEILFPKN